MTDDKEATVDHATTTDFNFEGLLLKDVLTPFEKPWWKYPNLRMLNILLISGIITSMTNGYDASQLNGLQSLQQWNDYFNNPKGAHLGALTFAITAGGLISSLFMYQALERFGRRRPIFVGSILIVIFSIVQASAQNYAMFLAPRFLIGIGNGIILSSAPPFLMECAHPAQRARVVSLYNGTWQLGALIAGLVNFGTRHINGTWSWRTSCFIQCVPSLIQAVLSYLAPESPRWLIYNDRTEEAFEMLTKYHAEGDRNSRLVSFEMAEISATLELEKTQRASRWKEWISTKGNRHRLFLVILLPSSYQLCGNALTSYYLPIVLDSIGITDSNTQLILNWGLAIFALIVGIFSALMVDKLGRRLLFLLSFGSMLVTYIIWTITSAINQQRDFKDGGLAAAVLVMIFLYSGVYQFAAPISPAYVMEITPFSLRSKAAMMYQLCGNAANTYNNFANPVIMEKIAWKYYIVWDVAIAIELVLIYFFLPETKGRSLEEVREVFEGPEAISIENIMTERKILAEKQDTIEVEYVE